jgi:glycosyltransferase involved in cell wall biosynthesis
MLNKEGARLDIICISLCRSDSVISSTGLFLAKEFAKQHRVFFIDHPYSFRDFNSQELSGDMKIKKTSLLFGRGIFTYRPEFPEQLTIVKPPVTFPINFLPNGFIYKTMLAINEWIVNKSIRACIKNYGIKDFVFINFSDPFFVNSFPKDIRPIKSIYYCLDDFSEVPYFQKHGLQMEIDCLTNYDYALGTSTELVNLKSAIAKQVYYLPNAADTDFFASVVNNRLARPKELASIHTAIIGYTGSIEFRMDFELLKKVALENPDKTVVLVGPIQTDEHIKLGIDKIPNVIFVGPKKIAEIPNYLQCFNCTIIPFRKSTTTKSVYPLKINEHLSAGLPVVTTNFSGDIESFDKLAYVESTHEGFLNAINRAIKENSAAKVQERTNSVSNNSWRNRVSHFWEIFRLEMAKEQKN